MKKFLRKLGGGFLCLGLAAGTVFAEPLHVSPTEEKSIITGTEIVQTPDGDVVEEEKSYWQRIEWGLIVDGIVQGNTNSSAGWDSQADAIYGLDLEALFPAGEKGSFYMKLEAGGGEGLDGRIPTFSGFNDHAWGPEDGIEFTELWYQHKFLDGHFRGIVGKIDLTNEFDTNQYANCEHQQFLSSGFINNLATEFPDNSFGGMFFWEPGERFTVGLGVQNNSGWDDVFHDVFAILEVGWHPVFNCHQGNYRFFGWTSSHSAFEDEEGVLSEAFTNRGWGLSFDQEITHHFGIWGRYSQQCNEDFNDIKAHASCGFQFMNFYWRPDDTFGVAYGLAQITDALRDSLENAGDESHIEIYYRCVLRDFFAVTPNVQWVKNPGGNADEEDVFVLGVRGTFSM